MAIEIIRSNIEMNFYKLILEDLAVHREGLLAQGFWAIFVYRLGHTRFHYSSRIIRMVIGVIHLILHKLCEILFGISIGVTAKIGRRLNIEHFGGIIIHGNAVIGDDCLIRQGVTIGNKSSAMALEAPTIGNRVSFGAGAVVIGKVTIGNDVDVGANAVIIQDVASNCIAVGVPAKVILKHIN